MTELHPITPPLELRQQWITESRFQDYCTTTEYVATQAARWGADQELDACCEWLLVNSWKTLDNRLRAARRPKPPSLKEQALSLIDDCTDSHGDDLDDDILGGYLDNNALSIIRTALEALPDD